MKVACFFLVALPLVFCGDNNSVIDRVAELLEARHPKLSGTGLVKQIVQAIGSDQLQGPCVQACGLVKDDDEHIDCSTACHVFQDLVKVKLQNHSRINKRGFWDFLKEAALTFKEVTEAVDNSGILEIIG